jgi:hypothetical protein
MDVREQIEAILSGVTGAEIKRIGNLWQIRIGNHAGAREDGVSLARDMLAMHQARKRAMEAPVPVEIPAFLLEPVPEPVPEAVAEPEPVLPEPEPETVPEALLDLVRENEPYGDTQTRLWELYLELNGKLMLGLATEEDARLHTRLHGHLAWISKGAAEVVT